MSHVFLFICFICVVTIALVATSCGSVPAHEKSEAMHAYVAISGDNSKIDRTRYVRVTSSEQMTDLWLEHLGHHRSENISPAVLGTPQVDFDRCMVIAIFPGAQYAEGVELKEILEDDHRVLVRFNVLNYQVSGEITVKVVKDAQEDSEDLPVFSVPDFPEPYGFFVIPHSKKQVVLEESYRLLLTDPRTWVQRASFERL